jgi:hypothetical protein
VDTAENQLNPAAPPETGSTPRKWNAGCTKGARLHCATQFAKEIDMNWKNLVCNTKPSSGITTHPHDTHPTEAVDPPRRIVLRGALAAGCSLLLPASLLGCDSQKETGSAAPDAASPTPESADPASPAPETESAAPAAPAKVSQASVQYQTQPKGEQKCSNCMHFEAGSNTCKLVEGEKAA